MSTAADHPTTSTTPPGGRKRHPLRALLPALLIVAWVAIAGVGGPYFGKIGEVSSNDQTSFLPASADATQVQQLQSQFVASDTLPAIVVYQRTGGLTKADLSAISDAVGTVKSIDGVGNVSPVVPSKDGQAAEVFVPIDAQADIGAAVSSLRTTLAQAAPDGVTSYVTGPAGFSADLVDAFGGIDGILLGVALLAVFVILIVVYRSPLLPLIVLATALFALCASILAVWWLAKAGAVQLNGQVQGILFILVIGAATDYSLLYVSRYREALRDQQRRWEASWTTLRGTVPAILASGGTVIAALLCLLLSDLNSNKALGPVAAIGIAFAMLSALTFLPALLLAAGRTAFWPLRPKFGSDHPVLTGERARGLWPRLGRGIARRPRTTWVVAAVALLAASAGLTQLKAGGVPQSDLILGSSQARDGQAVLADHFPGGSGSPTLIVGPQAQVGRIAELALNNGGISSVSVLSADAPSGSLPVTADGVQTGGPDGTSSAGPTVVDGRVELQATLTDPADSNAAEATVRTLRDSLDQLPGDVLVGGVTATAIDSDDASIHDRNLIIPIVLVVILLILMVLLRAVLLPVLLVLSVILSFAATLGVSALVFDHIFGFPGADPSVPLYGFIFLVALGIDYNIFLMTRVREETLRHRTRPGILRGLAVTGGVITSAGVVLAATFAALGVIPILFLAQLAFIVAFGVLLDTLVVRSLIIPALGYDIGPAIWWPSRLRLDAAHAAPGEMTSETPVGQHLEDSPSLLADSQT